MLTITVPGAELYDEDTSTFINAPEVELDLEHSLVSLSKWESEFEKPFLGGKEKSPEEVMAYVKFMILTPRIPEEVFLRLTNEHFTAINEYIDRKMSATWFHDSPNSPASREVITAELIYYWMTQFAIPFECENWHLNRLFTLIRIANVKQSKPKKMSRAEAAQRHRELNEQRKKQLGTTG